MQIDLGTTIRQLRRRDGRTQEALAEMLGVTSQAVSRWESGGGYPDINLIPSIANYFSVTIDELFGYNLERNKKVDRLVSRIRDMKNDNNGIDVSIDECIMLARDALVEFPGNEKLMVCLASVLFTAGYVRHGEHHLTDADGFSVYDTARHRGYAEWKESIALYEKVLTTLDDGGLRQEAVQELMQLYLNMGEYAKALALAELAPSIWGSRDFLRIYAFDGKSQVRAYGEALLKTVHSCAELMVQCVLAYNHNMTAAEKVQSISGAIGLFDHVCTDGNYGEFSSYIGKMYMLLSLYLWLDDRSDEAFEALDQALIHFKMFERFSGKENSYTAPLVRLVQVDSPQAASITAGLPEDWPWWRVSEVSRVREEMESDPRWDAWVRKCKS